MPSLTIKDIPEDVLEKLRRRAEKQRRSLTKEALYLLEQAVSESNDVSDDPVRAQVNAWKNLGDAWSKTEDRVDDIYASRSQGRGVDW